MSRAIAALRQARLRIEALERDRRVPIAVVGMGCRLPGAADLDAYWSLLRAGGDAIREVPPERWSLAEYYDADPRAPGRAASRHGGFVDGIFDFDRERFGIAQAEAEVMDPQQRLLLEVAAEAFERAGDADLAGSRTGVFVGISTHDFALRAIRDEATEKIGVYSGTGSASAIVAGRLAYTFGLRGPCLAMDAACASALVAVHLACQSLRDGDCDRALAAGVNAILSPAVTVYFSRRGVLAPDGVCRAFDAEGNGYARAEGCGALVLRRLDDALRAGDPVVGVIRGSAIAHNGRSNGLTAPNRAAQVDVIRRALADAGVEPGELGYVEAFGAGTRLGDGVELRALAEVLGDRAEPLPIGSVKTNIGHTEAASGVAALIKVLLCLEHGELPASLHLRRPNPALADAPVRVVQALERWATPRLAGTSAFGFGGTNAHVVLGAAPAVASTTAPSGPRLLLLTARTATALAERRAALIRQLERLASEDLDPLCRALAVGARHHAHRLAVIADSPASAAAQLRADAPLARGQAPAEAPALIFRCAPQATLDPLALEVEEARAHVEAAGARGVTIDALLDEPADERALTLVRQIAAGAALQAWGLRPRAVVGDGDAGLVREVLAGERSIAEALDLLDQPRAAVDRAPDFAEPVSVELGGAPLLEVLAALFVRGVDPRWAAVVGAGPRTWIPPHPHERARCRNAELVPLAGDRPPRGAAPASSPSSTRAALAALDPARRREAVAGWLSEQLANLGVPGVAGRSSSAFGELGLDSLAIVELIQAAQRDLEIQLYPDELFSAPSIDGLASRLADAIDGGRVGSEPAQEAAATARASAERLAATALVAPPFARPPRRLPGAVLLLSAPRCGSTLLRVMLAGHPRLFAPPELHLLAYPDMRAWHDALAPRMLHLGLLQALVGAGLDEAAATAQIARWRDEATPTSAVYAALMELAGDRRLVDKSPSYALEPRILERAEALFDRPRYVLLSRHPAAMIESFTRLRMGRLFGASDVDPHLFAEAIWARAYAALEAFAARVGARARWVRYEELVADPAASAAELCEFLDLDPDPGVLTPYAGERMVPDAGGAISFIGDPNFTRHRAIDATLGERWRDVHLPWRFGPATAELAARLGYAAAASRGVGEDLEADARLPDDLEIAASPAAAGELLLTGATGFLGAHLAAELLAADPRPLRCLVRASDPAAAGERVRAALAKYDLWRPEWAARLRVEPADLTAPRLGLSQARWDALALEVEAILHCGALVHFAQPYETLRAANVGGTLELLRLAGAARRKRFDFISTKGVFSASAYPGDEPIAEDDPVRRPSADTLSYQRSKWAAERLCWAAGARGLDVAIYRPGRIGGHSRSGQQNPDDLLCRFLIGCAQLGALPDIDVPVEVTPVDHVAATVARIAAAPGTCGRAYHLVHTAPLDPLGVRRALAACGLEVAVVGWRRWREQLFTQPTNALTPLRGLFTAEPPARVHEGRLATANTLAADPRWSPPPVAEQLAVNLGYLRRAGLLAHDAGGGADR